MRIPNRREAIEMLMEERIRELTRESREEHARAKQELAKLVDACKRCDQSAEDFDDMLEDGALMRDPNSGLYNYSLIVPGRNRSKILYAAARSESLKKAEETEHARVQKQMNAIAMRVALEKDYDAIVALIKGVK